MEKNAVENILLKGIKNPNDNIDKRIKFLKFLARNYVGAQGKPSFPHYKGEYDPKKSAEATTKMEGIFSPKGVELYQEAVKEEGESAAFRLALAYKAAQYFQGPKLAQLMYIWVGGASGSGKSFGANGVIKQLMKHMRNFGAGDNQGNYFVFVDGGIARQLSQVRKLALKMSLRCGFSAISDLNDISGRNDPLDVKKIIHNTAVESGRVNVIIPDTFSECVVFTGCSDIEKAEKLTREKNMLHVFSEVAPAEGKTEEFKNPLVPRMAEERANSKKYGDAYRMNIDFADLNDLDLPCESKAPPSVSSIGYGLQGTANARAVYLSLGESGKEAERYPRIHMVILNELMYIDYLGVNNSLRLAGSDFANYQKAIGNTPNQQLSVQAWIQEMKAQNKLAPALIIIERFDVDADRREFFELTNEAARAAGLPQPATKPEKAAEKRALRQSESLIQMGDPKREEMIRRLAHFACVMTAKTEITLDARNEMLDLAGRRICQLINTGVPKGAPTAGAEINVVREDCRKFAEWLGLLNRAVRQSHPDVQAEARRLIIKEWQAQILQSYAPVQDKIEALNQLNLRAREFLMLPNSKPAANVLELIQEISANTQQLTGVPVAPPRRSQAVPAKAPTGATPKPAQAVPPKAPPRSDASPAPNQTASQGTMRAPTEEAPPPPSQRVPKGVAPEPPQQAPRRQSTPEKTVTPSPVPPQRRVDPAQAAPASNDNNAPRAAARPPIPAARPNSAPPTKQPIPSAPVKQAGHSQPDPEAAALRHVGLFKSVAASVPNKPPARPKEQAGVTQSNESKDRKIPHK